MKSYAGFIKKKILIKNSKEKKPCFMYDYEVKNCLYLNRVLNLNNEIDFSKNDELENFLLDIYNEKGLNKCSNEKKYIKSEIDEFINAYNKYGYVRIFYCNEDEEKIATALKNILVALIY